MGCDHHAVGIKPVPGVVILLIRRGGDLDTGESFRLRGIEADFQRKLGCRRGSLLLKACHVFTGNAHGKSAWCCIKRISIIGFDRHVRHVFLTGFCGRAYIDRSPCCFITALIPLHRGGYIGRIYRDVRQWLVFYRAVQRCVSA